MHPCKTCSVDWVQVLVRVHTADLTAFIKPLVYPKMIKEIHCNSTLWNCILPLADIFSVQNICQSGSWPDAAYYHKINSCITPKGGPYKSHCRKRITHAKYRAFKNMLWSNSFQLINCNWLTVSLVFTLTAVWNDKAAFIFNGISKDNNQWECRQWSAIWCRQGRIKTSLGPGAMTYCRAPHHNNIYI